MERKIIKMSAPRCIKHSELSVTTQPAENIDLPRFKLRYSYQLHWTSRCYSVLNIWLCCQNPVSDVKRENTPNRSPRAPSFPLRTVRYRDPPGAAPPAPAPERTLTGRGLDRECCGDDLATGGTLRPGLVPGPLPPANWQRNRNATSADLIETEETYSS